MTQRHDTPQTRRLIWIDLGRSAALLAMAVFHAARDLEMFGALPPGTTVAGGWALFARLIVTAFLFLSGVSLVAARRGGLRLPAFWKRLAVVTGAAALVTVATLIATPGAFIYFGILHAIAAASLFGLLLLRLPAWGAALFGVAVLAVDAELGRAIDIGPWWAWAWTGIARFLPPSLDYIPLIPWLAPYAFGIAAAKALPLGWPEPRRPYGAVLRVLAWPGGHSLGVYLVHQPVLIAVIWALTRLSA